MTFEQQQKNTPFAHRLLSLIVLTGFVAQLVMFRCLAKGNFMVMNSNASIYLRINPTVGEKVWYGVYSSIVLRALFFL